MNMKQMKKWAIPVLATALTGSLLAGCAAEKETKSAAVEPAKAAQESPAAFKIFTMMSNEAPKDDNAVKLAMDKLTNTKTDITWVPQTAYNDKFNATLAADGLPHVMLVSSNRAANVVNAVRAGAFWEIGPYLKQFPNLGKLNQEVLKGTSYDGKIYLLPRSRDAARHVVAYRKDWLNNLGLQEPKTIDDFYNVAKAFTEKDPDQNGKNDTLGFVELSSLDTLTRDISIYFGSPHTYGLQDNKLVPNYLTPEYMEALKFYRKLYGEKIMNQDFALINGSQQADMANKGKVGMIIAVDSTVNNIAKEAAKVNPKAEFGFVQGLTGPKGLRSSSTGGALGGYVFSKGTIKTEAELLKILGFFDKLSDAEGMTLLYRGIKDSDYTVEGQFAIPVPNRPDSVVKSNSSFGQLSVAPQGLAMPLKQGPVESTVAKLVAENEKIAIYDLSRALISKTVTEKGPELDKMIKDAQVKFIMGQIDEAGFKKLVDDWRKAGADKVIEELNEEYKKNS